MIQSVDTAFRTWHCTVADLVEKRRRFPLTINGSVWLNERVLVMCNVMMRGVM